MCISVRSYVLWMGAKYVELSDVESRNQSSCAVFLWYCVFCWLVVALAGSMFHFAYQWFHCHWFVGCLVAVNESVFEHLKILVFPLLLLWFVDFLAFGDYDSHVRAVTVAVYSSVTFLVVIHLIVTVWWGYESLAFDIGLFVVSAFVAQYVGYQCMETQSGSSNRYMLALMIAVVCHVLFTVCPPRVPFIFEDPRRFYGTPELCYDLDFPAFKNTTVASKNPYFLTCAI